MKFIYALISSSILLFNLVAFADIVSTEGEISFVKSAVSKSLESSKYQLVPGSIDLQEISFVGVLAVIPSLGTSHLHLYKVKFTVKNSETSILSDGSTYFIVSKGWGKFPTNNSTYISEDKKVFMALVNCFFGDSCDQDQPVTVETLNLSNH